MYNIFDDIAGFLAYSRKVGRELDDRFLKDFSLIWKGIEDNSKTPEEYARAFQKAQKQTSVSTTVGDGNLRVVDDSSSNVIQIWSTEGAITVQREDVSELIQVLSTVPSGPTNTDATGTPQIMSVRMPGQNELAGA